MLFRSGGLTGIASQAVVAFHDGTADPTCVAATSVITTLNWAAAATPRTACVVNAGNGDLIVSNTTLPAVAGAQFSRGTQTASACTLGQTVAMGQFCTVVISRARPAVAPTAGTGTLTATDTGAAAATQVLQLSGT